METDLLSAPARVLRALFELAQQDCASHVASLSRALELGPSEVRFALARLEERGLVDARRVRLTMAGLCVAVRLPALRRVVTEPLVPRLRAS